MRKLNVMRTKHPLAQIVLDIFHNIDSKYVEEYKKGEFCLMNVPQEHQFVEMAINAARERNLLSFEDRNSVVIPFHNDFIRFNLVECDDEYAKMGDLNSLDMTANVWNKIKLVLKIENYNDGQV